MYLCLVTRLGWYMSFNISKMKKTYVILVSLFVYGLLSANITLAQPGYISTIAGDGIGGFFGDGGQALVARFYGPAGIAVDPSGNLYIADYGNDRIRKVTYATGNISTIAGSGYLAPTSGAYSSDGGPATAADLYTPDGITLDASGNIFFADQGNNRIRMINATTGIITTVAGDSTGGYSGDGVAATASELYYPSAVAFDGAGDLYIADWENNRIRKVTMSTGIISTFAGTGVPGYSGDGRPATAAKLFKPSSLAFDISGNLLITEYGNSTLRKITKATGIITTIAGTGVAGYSGDSSSSVGAQLNRPLDVKTDTAGNIYIADWDNYRVRMISSSSGLITTIAGDGTEGYIDGVPATEAEISAADGLSLDSYGNLYISDEFNNVIREVVCPVCVQERVIVTNNNYMTNIYPNPATSELTITSYSKIKSIGISNLIGQTVYTHEYNSSQVNVDVSTLPPGMYLVKINGTEVRKFVKE